MNCSCCGNPLHPFNNSYLNGRISLTHLPRLGDEVCVEPSCDEFLAQRRHSPRREGDEPPRLAA